MSNCVSLGTILFGIIRYLHDLSLPTPEMENGT